MGTQMGSMIQVREDLTRKPGDTVVFPTVRRLVGAGVTGNTILEGNEEILNARSLNLTVSAFRHAVAVSDWDEQKSVIDLREAAREALMVWELEKMRNDIITSLEAMTADGNIQVSYGAATAAQRNTWMVNNADRVLFGNSKGNAVSGVMATALLTIVAATGKMTAATVTLAKRIARTASPRTSGRSASTTTRNGSCSSCRRCRSATSCKTRPSSTRCNTRGIVAATIHCSPLGIFFTMALLSGKFRRCRSSRAPAARHRCRDVGVLRRTRRRWASRGRNE